MGNKKTYNKETYYQHLMSLLPESNFTLDTYIATEQPCEITCNNCKRHYTFSKASLLARRSRRGNKNVCRYCEKNKWTAQQEKSKNKALYLLDEKGTIKIISPVKSWGSRENVLCECSKCKHTFLKSPFVMFTQNNLSCPWCETHPFEYTEEMIKIQAQELWGDEYSVLQVKDVARQKGNKSRRIIVCHNKCGFKYTVNQYHFMHGQGCPRCKKSHGEWKIRKYLQTRNFVFQEQYLIKTKAGRNLKLDFYLEEDNKKYAIEYNGIQHYQPVDWFNGVQGFNTQCERDKDKAQYCKENNITLIIIPYNDETLINSEQLAQRLRGKAAEEYPSRTDENIV